MVGFWLNAQTTSLFINDNLDRIVWEQQFDINDIDGHAAMRPYHRPVLIGDTANSLLSYHWSGGTIAPILSSSLAASHADSLAFASEFLAGVSWKQDVGKRLALDMALFGGLVDGQPYERIAAASDEVYVGIGAFQSQNGRTGTLWDLNFSLRYKPSDIFTLELGKAKHFWGDGYRSLFLSDNAAAYPYFKIKTKVWHIEYSNLFSWQQAKLDLTVPSPQFEDKFTSSHILSWNVSPRLNVQLFESIIWQSEDSLSSRGFDVYYLNPIIFYRPVEFAAGSADNAIIGLGLDYKVFPSYLIYGQLVLDEFLLEEFLAGNGWWANKFGMQLGFKGFDAFGKEGLYVQAEFNVVRPFTYSHGSPVQNYAHLDQALAHPLGANFYEALLIGAYVFDGWELRNHASFVLKGDDEQGRNLGGDIFRSYESPYRNIGNFVGQGRKTEEWQNSIYFSRVLDVSSDTRLGLAYHFSYDMGAADLMRNTIGISLRSNFGDGYR
jgi:hypothetical protein